MRFPTMLLDAITDPEPGTAEELAAYAAREAASPETGEFAGGEVVLAVSVSLLILVALVILIIVLVDKE